MGWKGFVGERGLFWLGWRVAAWCLLVGAVVVFVKTGGYGFATLLALLGLAGLAVDRITRNGDLFDRQAKEAEMSALPTLDMFQDGFRVIGARAGVVLVLKSSYDYYGGGFSQLCRTQSGGWFVFDFTVFKGHVHDQAVRILKDDGVKQLLMECRGIEEYRQYFGEPDVL